MADELNDIAWLQTTALLSHEPYRVLHVATLLLRHHPNGTTISLRFLAGICQMSVRRLRVALIDLRSSNLIHLDGAWETDDHAWVEMPQRRPARS